MKVSSVSQSPTFEKKQRFIDANTRERLKSVLTKMNNEIQYKGNDYTFETTVTKRLVSKKNPLGKFLELIDARLFWQKKTPKQQMTKNSLLTIGKTELVINNETGEIIDFYKPFFTTWKNIMKRISQSISLFDNNFEDSNIVQKKKIRISGFTEKGYQLLCKGNK